MGLLQWLGLAANGRTPEVGDAAPEIAALDEQGSEVRLAEVYREGTTLVYFYPKADTPGCTAQACSLRDGFEALQEKGVRVIGVSADTPEAQRRFKEKFHLPFTLLADTGGELARAFGVRLIVGLTHRQAFLIREGRIIWRDLHASTKRQAEDVLKIVS